MRSLPVISVLLCSLVVSLEAQAVTVSQSALPQTIQSTLCPSSSSCSVSLNSSYSSGKVSAFFYDDQPSSFGWLIRYDLTSPSGQTDFNNSDPDYLPPSTQTTAYDGYLWMRVQGIYSAAAATHAVTLYRDKVTPGSDNLFGQNDSGYTPYADANGDLSLFMTTADLLAGSAFRTIADPGPSGIETGSLSGELPLPCLADGCQVHATLNLVQLQYQLVGTSIQLTDFNPEDTRGLVYRQSNAYHPYGSTVQTFAISAVPEPSVLAMLGCGLGIVAFAARRRRA